MLILEEFIPNITNFNVEQNNNNIFNLNFNVDELCNILCLINNICDKI
jgi:hypothetical protein